MIPASPSAKSSAARPTLVLSGTIQEAYQLKITVKQGFADVWLIGKRQIIAACGKLLPQPLPFYPLKTYPEGPGTGDSTRIRALAIKEELQQ
jgi:hypothetical protein